MRFVPHLLLAASLLAAAPALAQQSSGAKPANKQPAAAEKNAALSAKSARRNKPANPKATAKKPGEAKTAKQNKAKPVDVKLPTPRPEIAKADAKPAEPAQAKPAEVKLPTPRPEPVQTTASINPTQPKAAAITNAAPDAFAGIPPAERLKIQAALLWAGDYPSAGNGDDPMLTAIKNFQKRKKAKVTGTLTATERADLVAAAREREQEFGWSVVVDPATGIRIGLPVKMVPHAQEAARGTRWSSAHGEVQVETFRIADTNLKLAALFEQEKKEPASRKIETSVLRDDGFFISGLQGLKKFSVRATIRNGEVRGFTMLFDQMMETIVAPVMVAMSSAFSPFPERSAPFAALAKSVEYGNGLVVSAQGHIVTDRKLTEGCQVMVASGLGDAVRIADDKDTGLALLRVYAPRKTAVPLALTADTPKSAELTLVGIPDPKEQDGNRKLTEIRARLNDGSSIELRQPVPMAGFSGAAALDGQGRFLGMMEMRNAVLASIEPAAPPVRLIGAAAIRAFLEAHNVAASRETGDAKASVVRMICVRK
ncbi:MAG: peptidoglycan-binding protein [Rhizobiales bacterium]|nr:peptidoglycan-binding protein [Hyphomicrobiales bacterium]